MDLDRSNADIVKALKHCRDMYLTVPTTTKLIVTMGRYAMYSLTGVQNEEREYGKAQGVMESWRGYGLDLPSYDVFHTVDTTRYHPLDSTTRVLFTMHIAALFKGDNSRFMHAVLQDFYKIRLLLAGKWPQPLPQWHAAAPAVWPHYASFDTEYVPGTDTLTRWSLCDTDCNLYCVEFDQGDTYNVPIQPGSILLIQNYVTSEDAQHLAKIIDPAQVGIDDLMLANSVLWPGERNSLNYIASMYGSLNRWKHLSAESPQMYAAMDAHQPMYVWKTHYIPQFRKDPLSWRVYTKYRLPLIKIIHKAHATGARVDTQRLGDIQQILQGRLEQYQEQARQLTGDETLNLGGRKKMLEYVYGTHD